MEIAHAEKKKIEFDGKADAALSQMEIYCRQKKGKATELVNIREQIKGLRNRLCVSQMEFEKQKNLANRATRSLSDIRHFVGSFGAMLVHGETILKKLKGMAADLAVSDSSVLQRAQRQEVTADEELQTVRQQLAAANAEHAALLKQLQEIGGGICPFLKEQCRQFDPSKVEGDLKEKERDNRSPAEEERSCRDRSCVPRKLSTKSCVRKNRIWPGRAVSLNRRSLIFFLLLSVLPGDNTEEAVNGLRQWIEQMQSMPELRESGRQSCGRGYV